MPTLIEISDDLAKKFIRADNKRHAAKHILNEIDSLVYTTSKQSIDDSIKILIVQLVHELISGKRPLKSKINEALVARPEHISIFISASDKFFKKRTEDTSLSKRRSALAYLRHL
ncbi:MAG TPA: hypothetical protein VH396_08590 [Chitinophagaceae bacterium]|jgi:hypothetical protein